MTRRAIPGSVTCDWSHKEVAAVPPQLHNFSADCQSGWREEFNAQRLIYSSNLNLSDQPETLREIRKTLLDQGVQSIMLSGVRFQRRLWGFIGFDFIRKECRFSNIEKNIITAAAHIIEIYLEHESNKQQLRKSEYERQQIFDNINTPILLFDPNLNLIRANRPPIRLTRRSKTVRISPATGFSASSRRSRITVPSAAPLKRFSRSNARSA